MALIYKATNKQNNKPYIGFSSTNMEDRRREHINSSFNQNDRSYETAFHRAIRKYGIESFKWSIIEESIDENYTLKILEPKYILKYDSFGPNGYNMTSGGEGTFGLYPSPEHSKKISDSLKRTFSQSKYKTPEYLKMKTEIANKNMKNFIMPGFKNVNSIGLFITPWGKYESAIQAGKQVNILCSAITNYCIYKNNETIKRITRLNVNTKFPFKREHIGRTYKELGFSFIPKELINR